MNTFDPYQLLHELQQAYLLLSENQRLLNENQVKLQQATDLLCAACERLNTRQDIMAAQLGFPVQNV